MSFYAQGALRVQKLLSVLFCGSLGVLAGCEAPAPGAEPIRPLPPRASCTDGIRNGLETDVDCGPDCARCAFGKTCVEGSNCLSGLCEAERCVAPASCGNGVKDRTETDVDCGGGCGPCDLDRACVIDSDCGSGTCWDLCVPAACRVQNLVLLVGTQGAHGYPHLLWPHPDGFAGRQSEQLTAAFMQTSVRNGATGTNFGGTLSNVTDYVNPPAMASRGWLGPWAAGERFKRIYGIDNRAFGGFRSSLAASRTVDQFFYGSDTVPSNTLGGSDKNFIVAGRETPWLNQYGLRKSMTIIDGGLADPVFIRGANNTWLDYGQGLTLMAAAAVAQNLRQAPIPVIFMPDGMIQRKGTRSLPFYGENVPAGAPAPLQAADASALAVAVSLQLGIPLAELVPTPEDRARYGYTGASSAKLVNMRDSMIVAAKLLARGITAQIAIGYFDDAPADLFTSSGNASINASTAAAAQGNLYDAFMDDLMAVADPACPQQRLGDNTVIAMVGDTPEDGVSRQWWDPSRPSGAQNRLWVMSNGFLKTGAFGGDRPRYVGDSTGDSRFGAGEGGLYDLTTGDLRPFAAGSSLINGVDLRMQYGETAAAAVLYSVVHGQLALVNKSYRGPAFPALLSVNPPR